MFFFSLGRSSLFALWFVFMCFFVYYLLVVNTNVIVCLVKLTSACCEWDIKLDFLTD